MANLMKQVRGSVVWLLVLLLALLIPKPKGKKKIVSWQKVEELLKNAFGKDCHLFLVDGKYRVPTLESVEKFLREDKTDLYKYIPEFMDCDEFAFRLMGQVSVPGWGDITFGLATSKVHAYNCLIAEDFGVLKVYLVEPQSDEILFAREVKDENYRTVFVMM